MGRYSGHDYDNHVMKALEEAKEVYPFNAQGVIDIQIEIESFKDGLKRLKELESELF